jgi:hypothetical protein
MLAAPTDSPHLPRPAVSAATCRAPLACDRRASVRLHRAACPSQGRWVASKWGRPRRPSGSAASRGCRVPVASVARSYRIGGAYLSRRCGVPVALVPRSCRAGVAFLSRRWRVPVASVARSCRVGGAFLSRRCRVGGAFLSRRCRAPVASVARSCRFAGAYLSRSCRVPGAIGPKHACSSPLSPLHPAGCNATSRRSPAASTMPAPRPAARGTTNPRSLPICASTPAGRHADNPSL